MWIERAGNFVTRKNAFFFRTFERAKERSLLPPKGEQNGDHNKLLKSPSSFDRRRAAVSAWR